jgi:hypothetical protein
MAKVIRKNYPRDVSFGILAIVFVVTFFLSGQLFEKQSFESQLLIEKYLAEFLVSSAVTLMVLIIWEELLFPVKVIHEKDGELFRNHKSKLILQLIMYLAIPVIVVFLYLTYNVNGFRFFIWALVILVLPVADKLMTGINNIHDYLKLGESIIEYKDNELGGTFNVNDISQIAIIKDKDQVLSKLELTLKDKKTVLIDLDKMELQDYYEPIEEYIRSNYKELL